MNDYEKMIYILIDIGADFVNNLTNNGNYFIQIPDSRDEDCAMEFNFDSEGKYIDVHLLWSEGD